MKFIDLFSGLGGIRFGMQEGMNECIAYCELDDYARKSYEAIHEPYKTGEKCFKDITKITNEDWEELKEQGLDMIIGGFPCQDFSMAGKRMGFEGTRGTLFFDIARGISIINPKVVVLENVKGLISHNKGNTLKVVIETLEDLGYVVEKELFNSKYFGVPQSRERIIIVAWRKDIYIDTILSDIKAKNNTVESCIANIMEDTVDDKFILDRHLEYYNEHLSNKEFKHGEINVSGSLKGGFRSAGVVYDVNGVSGTLTTMQGGGREPKVYYKGHLRRLTPLECFRLQGYSDEDYNRAAEVNVMSKLYKQIGNSVTVPLFKAVGKEIDIMMLRREIEDLKKDSQEELTKQNI